jgi:hypothetical protein
VGGSKHAQITCAGLRNDQMVVVVSDAGDGNHGQVGPLRVTPFRLPDSCRNGYQSEMNLLIALSRYDIESKMPAYKGVSVRIVPVSA